MQQAGIIVGKKFSDLRGSLFAFNDFDMSQVVRFYEIAPANTELIRGWQGHLKEKKWFHCLKGSFMINIIELGDNESSKNTLEPVKVILSDRDPEVLFVPQGCATAIKAIEENSRIQVFSNFTLEESKNDDIRFPLDQWSVNWS